MNTDSCVQDKTMQSRLIHLVTRNRASLSGAGIAFLLFVLFVSTTALLLDVSAGGKERLNFKITYLYKNHDRNEIGPVPTAPIPGVDAGQQDELISASLSPAREWRGEWSVNQLSQNILERVAYWRSHYFKLSDYNMCGPASVSMLLNFLAGQRVTDGAGVVDFVAANGLFSSSDGLTDLPGLEQTLSVMGENILGRRLSTRYGVLAVEEFEQELQNGVAIVLLPYSYDQTGSYVLNPNSSPSHFVILYGYNRSDQTVHLVNPHPSKYQRLDSDVAPFVLDWAILKNYWEGQGGVYGLVVRF